MKPLCSGIFLSFLLAVTSTPGRAQYAVETDSVLSSFVSQLPGSTAYTLKGNILTVYTLDSMWIDHYNSAGAPFNDPELDKFTEKYLKEKGRHVPLIWVFELGKKWTPEEVANATAENIEIYRQADELKKKYKIDHLKSSYRYDEEVFWNATDEEQKRVQQYKNEKQRLLKNLKNIPYYESQHYSVTIVSQNWSGSASYMLPMIWPAAMETKMYTVEKLVGKVLYRQK